MKVFLSWSGDRSKAVASAFAEWLPDVIQAIEVLFSPDIPKGSDWNAKLDSYLAETSLGIVCITPENLSSEWLNFEVGALSKVADEAAIWTFPVDMNPGDIPRPLGKFQATEFNRDDVLKLVFEINKKLEVSNEKSLDVDRLRSSFDRLWPDFEEKVQNAIAISSEGNHQPARPERDILEEILEMLRRSERRQNQLAQAVSSDPVFGKILPDLSMFRNAELHAAAVAGCMSKAVDLLRNANDFTMPETTLFVRMGQELPAIKTAALKTLVETRQIMLFEGERGLKTYRLLTFVDPGNADSSPAVAEAV